jgi:hypothetical protein
MLVRQKQQREIEVIVDVLCDRCGQSCVKWEIRGAPESVEDATTIAEYATFEAHWGYGSSHDGEHWLAHLCEACAEAVREFIDAGAGSGVTIHS